MFDNSEPAFTINRFITEHQLSTKRDSSDQADDLTYPAIDTKAQKLAQSCGSIDNQILALARAGKPIPKELLDNARKLHTSSNDDDRRDLQGDRDAVSKDPQDIKKEQAVIDADKAVLKLANLSLNLQTAIKDDIRSKTLLMAGEKQDLDKENAYIKHDLTDISTNDRVLKALNGSGKDLVSALEASIASKKAVGHDRREDAKLEPVYANADVRDETINKFLSDALREDPYARQFIH